MLLLTKTGLGTGDQGAAGSRLGAASRLKPSDPSGQLTRAPDWAGVIERMGPPAQQAARGLEICTLQPPATAPTSPSESSTMYNRQVPLGLTPLKAARKVAEAAAGAGGGRMFSVKSW